MVAVIIHKDGKFMQVDAPDDLPMDYFMTQLLQSIGLKSQKLLTLKIDGQNKVLGSQDTFTSAGIISNQLLHIVEVTDKKLDDWQYQSKHSGNSVLLDDLTPPHDEYLSELIEQVQALKLPLYFGAIPINYITPYSKNFHPELHPVGKNAINGICTHVQNGGRFPNIWVYEKNGVFVMSDDYVSYYAALQLNLSHVPCLIYGKPITPVVQNLQGPLPKDVIEKLLG